MQSNYNDIIDIILTLALDEELLKSIVISGSIVPYLVLEEKSNENYTDLYILVKEKKINLIRKKIKKLSKEYQFDIISDSKINFNEDYGFKIKYENTIVGFFPYSIINNNLTIKNYWINKSEKTLNLKTKVIPNITKNSVIRSIKFSKDKIIRIMSPEFILIDKRSKEKMPGNPTKETMMLLNKISDETVLKVLEESISNQKIKINCRKINDGNLLIFISLFILLIVLLVISYICFKK